MATPRIRPAMNLPPLREALPDFTALRDAPSRSQDLLSHLRQLAQRLRDRQARRFYSTREASHFFGVDAELVRRAYGELQREGLLTRVRSSMTLLAPLRRQPRSKVRGVVGLPVGWHYAYCMVSTWREFYVRMENELRRRHFVADLIFFEKNEPDLPEFQERLLNHDLDYIVWYLPVSRNADVMRLLADCGVIPIVVREGPPTYPAAEYVIDWRPALASALRDWHQAGMRGIDVLEAWYMLQGSVGILDAAGIPYRRLPDARFEPRERFAAYMRRLPSKATGGVIALENLWNSQLRDAPWRDLLAKRRVLIRDRLDRPAHDLGGLTLDVLSSDIPRLAARIADDIASGRLPARGAPAVIPATYRPRVPAEQCGAFY